MATSATTSTASAEAEESRRLDQSSGGLLGCNSCVQNISNMERYLSVGAGAGLALAGISKGKLGGLLMTLAGAALVRRGITGHCEGYELLGIQTADRDGATGVAAQQGVKVEQTVTVNCSPEELYARWRDLESLPQILRHVDSVDELDGKRSRWRAEGPFGKALEWEAEIINDKAGEVIAWRSLPESDIETAGSVHFKPHRHNRGTAVTISMKYNPPAGRLADMVAGFFGRSLAQEIEQDLRNFKSQMEAGEIPTTAGQSQGAH